MKKADSPAESEKGASATPAKNQGLLALVAFFTGLFLAVIMIYSGNPVTLENTALTSFGLSAGKGSSWSKSRYLLLLFLVSVAFMARSRPGHWKKAAPVWLLFLPVCWLGWQAISATQSIDRELTLPTLAHFAAIVVCFYLGLLNYPAIVRPFAMWCCPIVALVAIAWTAWGQHFGGLEETRLFYEKLYKREHPVEIQQQFQTPDFQRMFLTPAFQKKIASNRVFGTFVYPNALASAILLFFPPCFLALTQLFKNQRFTVRGIIVGTFTYMLLACLYWSGSKAAFLVALVMAIILCASAPFRKQPKIWIISTIFVCGLALFGFKYYSYFARGATSTTARMTYWRAALRTTAEDPLLGTGPGTFSKAYAKVKQPDEEMARLAHNDYLQQASDSGIPGFVAYSGWIIGFLGLLYRKSRRIGDPLYFATWLGLAGWALHSIAEFVLYIPAIAWPAFMLMGWLAGSVAVREEGWTKRNPSLS